MPAVLASDIRKRYQKKNNNKNKKKEKATDKKVASSSSTPKPAVKGVQSKPKSTTPSKPKSTVKSKKNTGSGMTSTEAARHGIRTQTAGERARHKSSQEMTDYRWYKDFEKRSQAKKKNLENTGMTSTERARHQASYENKLAFGDYLKDKIQAQKEYGEYVEQRDKDRRKSYELQHKNTGRYANAVNPAHSRGMSYSANPNAGSMESRKNNETYFLKQALSGAWSIPEDVGKAVESVYNPTGKKENKALKTAARIISPAIVGYNDIKGDRYEKFNEQLNKDVRANDFSSQVAQGLGRMLPTMPLYAVGAGGALANLGKVNKATKAISTLAKPMSTAGAAVNTAAYYGERYDEAIKNGATPEQARKAALAYALPTAYLEGMGGAEKAFSKAIKPGINPLKAAVKSGLSEGLEEVAQTPWEEYTKKAYGKNIPLFGRGNQEAVFNPDQLFNSFAVGAVLGVAGGGASGLRVKTGISTSKKNIIDAVNENKIKINNEIMQDLKDNKISQEEADLRRKYLDHEAKRASDEAIAKIDKDAEIAMYGNASSEEPGEYNDNTPVEGYANAPNEEGYTDEDNYAVDEIFNAKEDPEAKARRETEEQERLLFEQQGIDYDNDPFYNGEPEEDIEGNATSQDEKTADVAPPKRYARKGAETPSVLHTDTRPPNRYVRGNVRTVYNTTDNEEFKRQIHDEVFKGNENLTYAKRYGDDEAKADAAAELDRFNGNTMAAVNDVISRLNSGETGKLIQVEAQILRDDAANVGDLKTAMNILAAQAPNRTEHARALQAAVNSKDLTPLGRLTYSQIKLRQEAKNQNGFDVADTYDNMNRQIAMQTKDIVSAVANVEDNTTKIPTENTKGKLAGEVRLAKAASDSEKIKERNKRRSRVESSKSEEYPGLPLTPKEIKAIMKEGLSTGDLDDVIINGGDVGDLVNKTSDYIRTRVGELSGDQSAALIEYLTDQFNAEVQSRRDKILKLMLAKTPKSNLFDPLNPTKAKRGKNKQRSTLEKLILYNNTGCFDDPDVAAAVCDTMGMPLLLQKDMNIMYTLFDIRSKIENDPSYRIDPNVLKAEIAEKYAGDEEQIAEQEQIIDETMAYLGKKVDVLNKILDNSEEKTAKRKEDIENKYRGNEDKIAKETAIVDETNHDFDRALNALSNLANKYAAEKLQSNNWQKARQMQTTFMLGNVKTMLRNVAPNMGMLGFNQAGRFGGALADKIASRSTGVRLMGAPVHGIQNTKSFIGGARDTFNDGSLGVDTMEETKMEAQRGAFDDKNPVGKALNKYADLTFRGLQLGDRPFRNVYEDQAIADFIRLNDGTEVPELVRQLAEWEALTNTFMDDNAVTDGIQKVIRSLNFGHDFGMGSILMPFVRTPVNLTRLMWYYSTPTAAIQVVNDIVKFNKAVTEEEKLIYQKRLGVHMSNAVSGALIYASVILLHALFGVEFTAGDDEDEWRENQYERSVHGHQEWSMRIGDRYYNFGGLAPLGQIMAQPVAIIDAFNRGGEGEFKDKLNTLVDNALGYSVLGLYDSFNLLYEQTMLQTLQNVFQNHSGFMEAATSLITQIPRQFIPSPLQQLAKATDPWQRDTTSDAENEIFRMLESSTFKIADSLPGLNRLLPQKTDAWGLPMQRYDSNAGKAGDIAYDVANAFIMPWNVSQIKEGNFYGLNKKTADAYANTISYIEKLNGMFPDKNLLPQQASPTIKINGEYVRLTGDERQKWQKDTGGKLLKDVAALLKTKDFNSLSEGQQATVIGNTLAAYKEQAKHAIANAKKLIHNIDSKFSKPLGAEDIGQSVGEYYTQIKQIGNSVMPEDQRPDGEEYYTASDYKRYYLIEKYENGELTEDQVIYYMKAADVLSDKWEDEMSAADKQGISKINFIMAKEEMTILSNDRNLDKRQKEIEAAKIADKYGDDIDQKQWLLTTLSNMGMYMPDNDIKKMVFDGDESDIIFDAVGVHAREMWEGNDKYCPGIAGKNEFDSAEQFYNALSMVDAEGRKKVDVVAAIDQINGTARQKACMLAAKGYSNKGVTFHDGGSIDIPESSGIKRPTLNTGSSSSKSTTKTSTAATTSTATKTTGTIASKVRQLQSTFNAINTTANKVSGKIGDTAKAFTESIMPTKPTTYADAYKTSNFGENRGDHIHAGIDIGVNRQTNIGAVSMTPGTIAYIGKRGGYGNVVEYLANDGHYIIYGHLDSIAKGLKVGQEIKSGTQLGIVGNTGNSDGIHLHLEVRDGSQSGTPVDPETVYDIFGDGIKTASADPNYQANSAYSSSSSSSSSSDSSSGSSGSGRSGGGSSKKKRKPISTGSSYGSYSYGGYTPSSSYSSGYTPGNYTPGSYNP